MTAPKIARGKGGRMIPNPLGYRRSERGRSAKNQVEIAILRTLAHDPKAEASCRFALVSDDGKLLARGADLEALQELQRVVEGGTIHRL